MSETTVKKIDMSDKFFEDFVWAKLRGYCPWPAKIVMPFNKERPRTGRNATQHCVFFFGSQETGYVDNKNIWPYYEKKPSFELRSRNCIFRKAIIDIEETMKLFAIKNWDKYEELQKKKRLSTTASNPSNRRNSSSSSDSVPLLTNENYRYLNYQTDSSSEISSEDNASSTSSSASSSMKAVDSRVDSADSNVNLDDSSKDSVDSNLNSVDSDVNSVDSDVNSVDSDVNSVDSDVNSVHSDVNSVDSNMDADASTSRDEMIFSKSWDAVPSTSKDAISSKNWDAIPSTSKNAISSNYWDAVPSTSKDAISSNYWDAIPSTSKDAISSNNWDAVPSTSKDTIFSHNWDSVPSTSKDAISSNNFDEVPPASKDAISSNNSDAVPSTSKDAISSNNWDAAPSTSKDAISSHNWDAVPSTSWGSTTVTSWETFLTACKDPTPSTSRGFITSSRDPYDSSSWSPLPSTSWSPSPSKRKVPTRRYAVASTSKGGLDAINRILREKRAAAAAAAKKKSRRGRKRRRSVASKIRRSVASANRDPVAERFDPRWCDFNNSKNIKNQNLYRDDSDMHSADDEDNESIASIAPPVIKPVPKPFCITIKEEVEMGYPDFDRCTALAQSLCSAVQDNGPEISILFDSLLRPKVEDSVLLNKIPKFECINFAPPSPTDPNSSTGETQTVTSEEFFGKFMPVPPTKRKIGFLGSGQFGSNIIMLLLGTGHAMSIWNKTQVTVKDKFIPSTVSVKDTVPEVVEDCEIVFCYMRDSQEVKEAVYEGEVLKYIRPGQGFINFTVTDPECSLCLNEAISQVGGRYLECPLLPSKTGALKPMIALAAGDMDLIRYAAMSFCVISEHIYVLGKIPSANKMAIVISSLTGTVFAAVAEGLTLATRMNIDSKHMLKVLRETEFASPIVTQRGKDFLGGNLRPLIPLRGISKDMFSALSSIPHEPMPITAAARQIYVQAKPIHQRLDICSIREFLLDGLFHTINKYKLPGQTRQTTGPLNPSYMSFKEKE